MLRMIVGNTLRERLKFAADILQAINLMASIVGGMIIWAEFDPFAGILAIVFFVFVTWCIKLVMYALSQLSSLCELQQNDRAQQNTGESIE